MIRFSKKRQEAFTKSYLGLQNQEFKRSVNWQFGLFHGACSYRGADGLKCAVGHLIDDNKMKSYFEDVPPLLRHPIGREIIRCCGLRPTLLNSSFLRDLQEAHDDFSDPDDMQSELHDVAVKWKLTVPTNTALGVGI